MNKKTLTEHAFLMQIWRPLMELQFYYAFQVVQKGEGDLENVLRNLTMTWFWVPWAQEEGQAQLPMQQRNLYGRLLREFADCFAAQRAVGDPFRFSVKACEILQPWVEAGDREYRRIPNDDVDWFGCFGWNRASAQATQAGLHFYNACCPRSPFDEMKELSDDLRQCLCSIKEEAPEVTQVSCGSWINNLKPFLALFPESYAKSLVESNPNSKAGMGWWGQFITKEGTLNEKRATELRQTGRFYYPRKTGTCSLDDALTHIKDGRI